MVAVIKKHPIIDLLVSTDGEIFKLDGTPRKLQDYGYLKVMINKKSYAVHRLVAETFIDNPDNKPLVNHINGNRQDNRVENLEWVDASENMQKASMAGTLVQSRKQVDIYTIYGDLIGTENSIAQAAKIFDIKPCALSSNIKRGSITKGYYVVFHGDKPTNIYPKLQFIRSLAANKQSAFE